MSKNCCHIFLLALLTLNLSACVTLENSKKIEYSLRGEQVTLQEGREIHSAGAFKVLGIVPVYMIRSRIAGNVKLGQDPHFLLGKGGNDKVRLTIKMTKPKYLPPVKVQSEIYDYIQEFSANLESLLNEIWGIRSKRKFDITLYIVKSNSAVARQKTAVLFSNTFHIPFYSNERNGFSEDDKSTWMAHEIYHLMVSELGAHKPPENQDLNLSSWQRRVLNETGARLFGACLAMRVTGKKMYLVKVAPLANPFGGNQQSTPNDAQIRKILQIGNGITNYEHISNISDALYLALWAEFSGTNKDISIGSPAAEKLFDLCANHIAHPNDLWPVLWALANDGKDAPEIYPLTKEERMKIQKDRLKARTDS